MQTLIFTILIFLPLFFCHFKSFEDSIENYLDINKPREREWPFQYCTEPCPRHWECRLGFCRPKDQDLWTFHVANVSEDNIVTLVSFVMKDFYFIKIPDIFQKIEVGDEVRYYPSGEKESKYIFCPRLNLFFKIE